jgi:beta-N-acetylhexosaminidase
MNLVQKIGQMLVFGWNGEMPGESCAINVHARALIEEFHVGGIILMGRNVEGLSPERARALIEEFQSMALATGVPPLLVSVDQEGGRSARFGPPYFNRYPTAKSLGDLNSEETVQRNYRGIGHELGAIGVNCVLAPVLDVNNNPANPVIGDRSFGDDASLVGRLGAAAVRGLQEEACVMACGKHFPGHGDTDVDSHLALPTIRHGRERLNEIELAPFRDAIDVGIGSIMTAHILFPELDPYLPASLSRIITTDLLRKELDYDGIIVTDCLEMKGVATDWGTAEAAVLAAIAGADLLLACHTYETQKQVIDALVDAVTAGRLSEDRIDEANELINKAKRRWVVEV